MRPHKDACMHIYISWVADAGAFIVLRSNLCDSWTVTLRVISLILLLASYLSLDLQLMCLYITEILKNYYKKRCEFNNIINGTAAQDLDLDKLHRPALW